MQGFFYFINLISIEIAFSILLLPKLIKTMNKIISIVCIGAMFTICSCGGGAQMPEADLNKMADSIANIRMQEMEAKSNQDCEARMATETKTIMDSILKSSK
jgi:uncharacterized membrane protein